MGAKQSNGDINPVDVCVGWRYGSRTRYGCVNTALIAGFDKVIDSKTRG